MTLWDEVLVRLLKRLSPITYDTWFHCALSLYEDEHRIVLLVPNTLYEHRYATNFQEVLQETFAALGKPKLKLYCIAQSLEHRVSLVNPTDHPDLHTSCHHED